PYAANTPESRTESVGHVKIEGRRQPLVFNGQGHNLYPLANGLRGQTMAWHPDGYLVAASSFRSPVNPRPPPHPLPLHPPPAPSSPSAPRAAVPRRAAAWGP